MPKNKNAEYWRKRFELLEQAQNKQGVQAFAEIEQQCREAQRTLEGQITAWYGRFADNNNISMAEARKMLTSKELAEFKWDVHDYIRYGEDNANNGVWAKQLENTSARYHINRLEALKMQTQQTLEVMFDKQLDTIDTAMRNIYRNGYYHSAFEIQKGIGIGWDFATLDNKKISKVINKPWAADGKNFSERIWGNRQKLVNELHTELTRSVMLGQDPQKAIDTIARKMNTSKNNAGRLIMTEQAFFSSAAQRDCFNELDVEKYEIVATLDSITSDICRSLDRKVFPMKDYQSGITAPPFHVWCRTTTVPYFDDDFGLPGERAARGEDGKTYYVPSDMTYPEWKKAFVEGDKSKLQEASVNDTIKAKEQVKNIAEELKIENFPDAFTAKAEIKNTQALVDYVNGLEGADANVITLYNRMGKMESIEANGIPFKINHGKNCAIQTSSYNLTGEMADVKLTIPRLQGENLAGQVNTTLHEEMHLMDLYGRQDVKKSGNWFSTSRTSLVNTIKNTSSEMSNDVAELFKAHDERYKQVYSAVSADFNKRISELNDSYLNGTFPRIYKEYQKQYKALKAAMELEIDYQCRNIMGGGIGNLEDIYDALSGGQYRDNCIVLYGHGSSYYKGVESRVHEIIANYAALSVTRPDLIDLLRADKPDLVTELEATVLELLKKVGE